MSKQIYIKKKDYFNGTQLSRLVEKQRNEIYFFDNNKFMVTFMGCKPAREQNFIENADQNLTKEL